MTGFTPISESAFKGLVQRLPKPLRLKGRALIMEILFRTRRTAGWYEGVWLERSQFVFGYRRLGTACDLSFQTTRTLISQLKKVGFLTIKPTRAGSIGTVENIDTYIIDRKENNKETNEQLTNSQQTANNIPNVKGKRVKKNTYILKDSPRAHKALQYWTNHAPLPISANHAECLKALDDLHCLDEVPWEGPAGIFAICEYAAKVWHPAGYIGSPVVLRKWTQAKDMRKWEKIQQQISQAPQAASKGRSNRQAYHIANAHGEPIKGPQERLERILKMELDHDPDQGHPWSISVEDIALARAGNAGQSQPNHKRKDTP